MQPPTIGPRSAYTADQITALIRDATDVEIGAGMELINRNLDVELDLTDDLVGGAVRRQSYATMHGSAQFEIMRMLDWGVSVVRPYVTLDGVRFNMGAYFVDSPEEHTGSSPTAFAVTAHDMLTPLADRVGMGYSVDAGNLILQQVEGILLQQGYTRYIIDQSGAAFTMPSARNWAIDDNTTWLTIVNDLLASVGYAGIWSDWDGYLRCEPYVSPLDRAPEWYYTAEGAQSQLSVERVIKRDLFDAANRWIAVRQNNIEGAAPIEGAGMFTLLNENVGPTSIAARGRVITAPLIMVDAADQSALEAAAYARRAADISRPMTIQLGLPSPGNPLHWHFDRCYVNDPAVGLVDVLVTEWTYPLAPSTDDSAHVWTVLNA